MRVTTQMLNESARRAGLPVNNTSLLNYVNGGASGSKSLLDALQSKASGQAKSADKSKYVKLEKAAEGLGRQADKFIAEGGESLLGEAKVSGDYTAVYKEIEELVSKYNSTVAILESAPGTMNDFYRRSMQELAAGNKDALDGVGVSFDRSGRMQVDQEKLQAADKDALAEVFGREGDFTSKLSFLAGRVEDNAESNMASASGRYSSKGAYTNAYLNRYDYRG